MAGIQSADTLCCSAKERIEGWRRVLLRRVLLRRIEVGRRVQGGRTEGGRVLLRRVEVGRRVRQGGGGRVEEGGRVLLRRAEVGLHIEGECVEGWPRVLLRRVVRAGVGESGGAIALLPCARGVKLDPG